MRGMVMVDFSWEAAFEDLVVVEGDGDGVMIGRPGSEATI